MTVFVYINTAKEVGDVDYVKVFANQEAAERWIPKASRSNTTFLSEPHRPPHQKQLPNFGKSARRSPLSRWAKPRLGQGEEPQAPGDGESKGRVFA
jgi:hypothetical protein